MWQPETWVQLLQPIVNFLNQVVQRLGCNTEHQLQQMQQSVASLQQAAQAFKEHGACAGDYGVMNNLGNLDRQADLIDSLWQSKWPSQASFTSVFLAT